MNISARGYLLVVLIVVLGVLGEWGPPLLDGLWRFPAAAVVILGMLEGSLARHSEVEIERLFPNTLHLGRSSSYAIRISNPQQLALSLQTLDNYPRGIDEVPEVMRWRVQPDTSTQQHCHITATQLGDLGWKKLRLRILGRFGLVWWTRQLQMENNITVVPDRLYASELRKTATAHQGDTSRRITGTGHELVGMRDYQHGDPLHFIDWKATARSQRPTVRLYSDEQHLELIIVIDAGRTSAMQAGKLTRLGHYCNVAARLAEKAIHSGDEVGVVVFSDRIMTSMRGLKGHAGLQRLRSILEHIKTVPRESNPLPAIMQVRSLARHRSLVVMLTDLDDGEAANQLVKAMSLLRQKHQPLLAAIMDREVRELQQQISKEWLDPYYSLAANEMIQNWQHTRIRLEGMGVPVVLSGIEQLDNHVLGGYEQLKQRKRV